MVNVPSGARCLGCRYALEWLEAPRCPECGRAFDPGDSSTFWSPGDGMAQIRRFVPRWVRWAFETPLIQTDKALAGWLLAAAAVSSLWQLSIPLGVLGSAVAAGITAVTLGDLLKLPRANRRRMWSRFAAAALVAVALNVGVERCPHAAYLSLGPISVPVSGKACHNPRHPTGLLNLVTGTQNPWGP